MARLFGLTPAPVDSARVLEIGCGDGMNLVASALVLPGATFHGIDLSRTAIERGRKQVRELGLTNVRLRQSDLRSWPQPGKPFHYVVAHGLYSWLPPGVRKTLLATIRNLLHPDGIAFVSYNAFPGAYLRQMVREMAGLFAGEAGLPAARAWLETARQAPPGPTVYRAVVADEAADMLRREDGALFHDDFSKFNQPVWFRDFAKQAARHGLQYLAEADLATTGLFGLPPDAARQAEAFAGPERLALEQYADYLRGRRFRQSLLCHAQKTIPRQADSGALNNCFLGGPLNPGIPQPDGTFEYVSRVGGRFLTADVEDRAILESLSAAWPAYLPAAGFGRGSYPCALRLFAAGMLDVRTVPPPVDAANPLRRGARPHASPLARSQARHGDSLTTLHHLEVFLAGSSLRSVLSLADGTRNRTELLRDLRLLYPSETKASIALMLDRSLEELRQYGLLTST
jgi:hypothetical protein